MPRGLTVKGYPTLRAGQTCPGLICNIERKSKPQRLIVSVRNLESKQYGRMHEVILPLPVRPDGTTAEFFRALGHMVEVGRAVPLRDAVGQRIRISFGASSNGQVEIVSFAPPKEERDAAVPE